MDINEKVRLFNGQGAWSTYSGEGKFPYFTMSDGPNGIRKQTKENYSQINKSQLSTCFPSSCCIASSWNRSMAEKVGIALAKEASFLDVDVLLAPGINIKRSPLCGRNFEYFSEDPFLTGQLAVSYVKGLQDSGVGCCVKHYACNNQETRRQVSNSIVDKRTLHEIYLYPFELVIKHSSPVAIMASYNKVNGVPVCRSSYLLKEVLRRKWSYSGVVISDWGACLNPGMCLKAGMDLAMPDSNGYFDKKLKEALEQGQINSDDLEKANQRVLTQASIFSSSRNKRKKLINYNEQHKLAQDFAKEGAVLLKNNGVLPLEPKSRVIVIGEFATHMKFMGQGSSHINCGKYPDVVDCLKKKGFKVQYESGNNLCAVKELARLAFAKNIPVLFFCGLPESVEGEGFDRKDINLPGEQIKLLELLLKTGCNVTMVSFSGSAFAIPHQKELNAILHMYLCGEGCGQACADLLSGDANPSGRLAETFPVKNEDVPCYKDFAPETDNVEYSEGVFVGYRYYNTFEVPVSYEFGWGLSYTTFDYSDFCITPYGDTYLVSFNVKNTGRYAGAEVCQVYVETENYKLNDTTYIRPKKELKGFDKVFLDVHEQKTVKIVLDKRAFTVYSVKDEDFVSVQGEYNIQVCSSVSNVIFQEKVSVNGKELNQVFDAGDKTNVFSVPEYTKEMYVQGHKKGSFTTEDCLEDLSKESITVRFFLGIFTLVIRLMNFGKSKDDPVVKIAINAIKENPLESLISTSGGAINEKLCKFLVKRANR